MEYSYFTLQGRQVNDLACEHCDSDTFNVEGRIKYLFLFLEFLPFFPMKKEVILSCVKCESVLDNSSIEPNLYKSIKKNTYKLHFILPMYTGLFLSILALAYWQFSKHQ